MPKGQRFQHATLDGVVNIELTSYASHVSHVVHIYVPMQHLRTMGMVTQSIAMHDTMLATVTIQGCTEDNFEYKRQLSSVAAVVCMKSLRM